MENMLLCALLLLLHFFFYKNYFTNFLMMPFLLADFTPNRDRKHSRHADMGNLFTIEQPKCDEVCSRGVGHPRGKRQMGSRIRPQQPQISSSHCQGNAAFIPSWTTFYSSRIHGRLCREWVSHTSRHTTFHQSLQTPSR